MTVVGLLSATCAWCCAAPGHRPDVVRRGRCRGGSRVMSCRPPGPASIQGYGILHAGVEALAAMRGLHVCGIKGQQHAAVAVGGCMPRHVGELEIQLALRSPKSVAYTATSVRGARSCWGRRCGRRVVREHDPIGSRACRRRGHAGADAVATEAELRLLVHLDLGDHPAGRRDRTRRSRCRLPCGSGCVLRRSRRGTPIAATCRRTTRHRRRCRPGRSPPARGDEGSDPELTDLPARMRSKWLCHSARL